MPFASQRSDHQQVDVSSVGANPDGTFNYATWEPGFAQDNGLGRAKWVYANHSEYDKAKDPQKWYLTDIAPVSRHRNKRGDWG
jgi:hypothetical protein